MRSEQGAGTATAQAPRDLRPTADAPAHEPCPGGAISDRMLRARRHYTDALGLALVPIEPGSKKPGEGLNGWQRRRFTPEELDAHVHAGGGLGAVHGPSRTGALDLDKDKELVAVALAAAGVDLAEILEAPGPKSVGNPDNPPKPWYRVPEGYDLGRRALRWPDPDNPTQRVVVLELRAGSVQDVLPLTVHPDTGEPYRWVGDIPRRREDLPLIPGPLLGLWLAWDRLRPMMEAACPWAPGATPEPTPTPSPASRAPHTGLSIIDTWNERVPVGTVLERNGYRRAGSRRWIAPSSKTGMPGVFLCDTGRVYSYHESDVLAGKHAHDSFGLLSVLEHAGDPKEAARSAARELGMDTAPVRAARTRELLTGSAS